VSLALSLLWAKPPRCRHHLVVGSLAETQGAEVALEEQVVQGLLVLAWNMMVGLGIVFGLVWV